MSTSALRKSSKSIQTLLAALALSAAVPAMAQEARSAPIGIYGGATFGIGAAQWQCGTTCDRAAFSGKLFGGKRLTPGLAAEINYLVFGGLDNANDSATTKATGVAVVREKYRAVTAGINWEIELLNEFTNSLRFGWAFTRRSDQITYADGSTARVKTYGGAPYFGAGFGYHVTRELNLVSTFDYVIDSHQSYYLFSVGGSAEF